MRPTISFLCLFTLIYCSFIIPAYAQDHVFGSWAGWFNNVRFSEKWGMNNDVQLRTGSNWRDNTLLLLRPGVNYYINDRQTASAGYATTLAFGPRMPGQTSLGEHRIWEQYIITGRIIGIPVQHRFRLEQRFLQRPAGSVFSQRARYFFRGIIPLAMAVRAPFTKGPFMSLQNELFFHIQNANALNGFLFDQNRAYTSLGYRFSAKYDLEIGYMNQFLLRSAGTQNGMTHIAQLAFYTRL
jgi:hypothetical protein